jgi:hypothetical protein
MIPKNFIYTYFTIIKTKHLGINIKILLILTSPAALISYHVTVIIFSPLVGILFALGFPWISMKKDINCDKGIIDAWKESAKLVRELWSYNNNTYLKKME